MKMIQIIAGHFDHITGGTRTYVIVGLDSQGIVWRYDHACKGWVQYVMKPVTCKGHAR